MSPATPRRCARHRSLSACRRAARWFGAGQGRKIFTPGATVANSRAEVIEDSLSVYARREKLSASLSA